MVLQPKIYIRDSMVIGDEIKGQTEVKIHLLSVKTLEDFMLEFNDFPTREMEWKSSLDNGKKSKELSFQIDENYEYLFTDADIKIWVDKFNNLTDYLDRKFSINNLYVVSTTEEAIKVVNYLIQFEQQTK